MPIGHQDHRGVPVTPSVSRSSFHQPLDLSLGEEFARAQVAIGRPFGGNCSDYGGWRDQPEVPFAHAFRARCHDDCSDNSHFSSSLSNL